jgi:hypothetical protein
MVIGIDAHELYDLVNANSMGWKWELVQAPAHAKSLTKATKSYQVITRRAFQDSASCH